ncbi:MAG: hypothetical protein E7440_07925 [Ruminococcaceae bacterium]|nr:hypothetical protein [Oscillospiraceae bacterium]
MQGKRVLKKQKPQLNSSLLGTYFVSLFSVLLCVVMLLGTTFAWFYTDNTSTGNEIHSGILKVDMFHVAGGGRISLSQRSRHSVFSSDQKWIPGMEQTQTVEVINTGNMPLSYKLYFTPETVEAGGTTVRGAADPWLASLFTVSVKQNGVRTMAPLDEVLRDKRPFVEEQLLHPGETRTIDITLRMGLTDDQLAVMGRRMPLYLMLEASQYLADTP